MRSRIRRTNNSLRFKAKSNDTTLPIDVDTVKYHLLDGGIPKDTLTNKDEALELFKGMYGIRRLELQTQSLYTSRKIRGFLHLYNGQEAVVTGLESVLRKDDHVITAYRDHGHMLSSRCGGSYEEVFAELIGKRTGCSKGKGGSMHMYKMESNFYGGNGIVGAQIPLGTGIAYTQKYKGTDQVTMAYMGDGAANQGQVYESFNMAKIWNLPCVYVVENNHYSMGTAVGRHSATPSFYTRGNYIPGVQVLGTDVYTVREAGKFAVDYAREKGPIVLEVMTYRFKGHSMSDPGTSYRTNDEVKAMVDSNDPVKYMEGLIIDNNIASQDDIKALKAAVDKEINEAKKKALAADEPNVNDQFADVYKEKVSVRGRETGENFIV